MQQHVHKALCDPTDVLSSVHSFINHVLRMLLSKFQCHLRQGKCWERSVTYPLHTSRNFRYAEGLKRQSSKSYKHLILFLKLL